jgi:hypothetical protein
MRYRAATAAVLVVVCVVAAAGAVDAMRWSDAVHDVETPATLLPGDPVGDSLGLGDDVAFARAARAFHAAERQPVGFDNGERRARARAVAAGGLSDVAAEGEGRLASRAHDLLGVLALGSAGRASPFAVVPTFESALGSFRAAIVADDANTAAKSNLELLLRQSAARGRRPEPGRGSGSRGGRGAGASPAGAGY